MSTPLTDSINALTAYVNETTGAEDVTLSDAVGRLCDGYGGSDNVFNKLFVFFDSVTLQEESYTITFRCVPHPTTYLIVTDPPGTKEFAAESTKGQTLNIAYIFFRGVEGNIALQSRSCFAYRKTPTATENMDWWTSDVFIGDGTITVDLFAGRYKLNAGVTYYLIKVKGA